MKIITGPESEQGSPAWHSFRKGKIGASHAAAIMGIDPWTTPYQLWRRMLDLDPWPEENEDMRRGKELESIARESFEKDKIGKWNPCVVVSDQYEWIFASLDGYSDQWNSVLEIKCPRKNNEEIYIFGKIPDHHRAQLQHQMYVTNTSQAWYFSYTKDNQVSILILRDDDYISKLIEAELEFKRCLDTLTPPQLTSKDKVQRNDQEWKMHAETYRYLKTSQQITEKALEQCREKLIELSGKSNSMGGGISVQKIAAKGGLNYLGMIEDYKIDIEKYRQSIKEYWRVDVE